jgi:hypothetical protein
LSQGDNTLFYFRMGWDLLSCLDSRTPLDSCPSIGRTSSAPWRHTLLLCSPKAPSRHRCSTNHVGTALPLNWTSLQGNRIPRNTRQCSLMQFHSRSRNDRRHTGCIGLLRLHCTAHSGKAAQLMTRRDSMRLGSTVLGMRRRSRRGNMNQPATQWAIFKPPIPKHGLDFAINKQGTYRNEGTQLKSSHLAWSRAV